MSQYVRKTTHYSVVLSMTLMAFTVITGPSHAQTTEKTDRPEKVCTVEGITEYKLKNGLRFLLAPDRHSTKVIVNMTVLVGSRHEGQGEGGMAHLLEHMLFKETPTHKDIMKLLNERGGTISNTNATTSVDRTNYYETLPASDDNLEFAIRLEADRLVNSLLRPEVLRAEMPVVRNEFEINESDSTVLLRNAMFAAAFRWQGYGRSVVGNRYDIERVPVDRLKNFYQHYYRPDNVVLTVGGKFDEAKALSLIEKYFAPLTRPTTPIHNTYTEEPAQDGERQVVVRHAGGTGTVGVLYHIPAARHDDFVPLMLLAQLLSEPVDGRLAKSLVATNKAATVIGTAEARYDAGVIQFAATQMKNQPMDQLKEQFIDAIETLAVKPVSDSELAAVKQQTRYEFETMLHSSKLGITISEYIALGDWRLIFILRDRVDRVTPADLQRVASSYLVRNNRTVGLYIPEKGVVRVAIPTAPAAQEIVKDYRGRADQSATSASPMLENTPEILEKSTQRTRFPGGMQVALLPRQSKGNEVCMEIRLPFGNEKSLQTNHAACEMLSTLIIQGGSRKHTFKQLTDELAKLKSDFDISTKMGMMTITLISTRENFARTFELMMDTLREPVLPAELLASIKQQLIQGAEQSRNNPLQAGVIELTRSIHQLPQDDIRYQPTIDERIARLKAVTIEKVRQLYQEQIGTGAGQVAMVGDFDSTAVLAQLRARLDDWKANTPYQKIAPIQPKGQARQLVVAVKDCPNAFYLGGLSVPVSFEDADFLPLRLAGITLGGDPLNSRLINRVRKKDSLSYSAEAHFICKGSEPFSVLLMLATCNPENMSKLHDSIGDEFSMLIKEGVTGHELAQSKKSYLQRIDDTLHDNKSLAGRLADDMEEGKTLLEITTIRKKVEGITLSQVQSAVRKHWELNRLTVVRAGEFKGDKITMKEPSSQKKTN